MAEYLNDAKFRQYTQLFSTFDYHSKGFITAQSVFQILSSMQLRVTLQDAIHLLKQAGNKSPNCSQVELSQFLAIISIVIEDKDMNKEIYELFQLFDRDKNKVINKDDFEMGFKQLQTDLSEEDILKLIQSTGKDSFNLREFRKYLLER